MRYKTFVGIAALGAAAAGVSAFFAHSRFAGATEYWQADMALSQLSLSKSGGINTYTVKVQNKGDDAARVIRMVFHIPAGKTLASPAPSISITTGSGTGAACDSTATTYGGFTGLVCTIATLGVLAEATITINVNNSGGGAVTASAQVFNDVPEGIVANATNMSDNFQLLTQ